MLYEIINPSDKYTIEAHSLDVAFVACLFLGNGQYSFEPLEEGGLKIPFFMFGNYHESWALQQFSRSFADVISSVTGNPDKRSELADCFESCLCGDQHDRRAFFLALALIDDPIKRDEWRAKWQDDRRSSLNDIGSRAYAMAKKLREGQVNQESVPQQVFEG